MDNRSHPNTDLPFVLESAIDALTERQREILQRVQNGCSNKEIARQLGISEGTVKQHLVTIFRQLKVRNRTMAANLGLLSQQRGPEETETTSARPEEGGGKAMLFASALQPVTLLAVRLLATESLMHRLGSAHFGQLNRRLQQLCQEAAQRFRGVLQGIPGGFLVLFGVPHIREDDPERAACCAFWVQRHMADHPAVVQLEERLPLWLCTVSGEVVASADGGKTTLHGALISHPCLASFGSCTHEPRPHLSAATRQALRQCSVRYGMPSAFFPEGDAIRHAMGLASGGSDAERSGPFVGRDGELRALLASAQEVREGATLTTVIVGEAGFGKTRLVQRLQAALTVEPAWLWLEGRCRTVANQIPYYPLATVLERLSDCPAEWDKPAKVVRMQAWLQAHYPAHAESGRRLLALLNGTTEHSVPGGAQGKRNGQAAAMGVLWLAILSATQRPTVLFLDNLQWADADTLALFARLAQGSTKGRLWLLGASRRSWLRLLPYDTGVTSFPLGRLPPKRTIQLLKALHPPRLGQEEFMRQMAQWSSGVPLFATELGKNLGEIQPTEQGNLLSCFPHTLHGLILERLDAVSVDWPLVRAIAAHGRILWEELLELGIHSPKETTAAVAHLVKIGLLGESDHRGADNSRELFFNNEMVRAAIWLTLLEGDRRILD